jgi:hypothetical protein
MWGNCAHHLVAELKILRPELVIFHAADAKWSVTNVLRDLEPIELEQTTDISLYRWSEEGAHLLFAHRPARGMLARQWSAVVVPALNYLRARNVDVAPLN